MSNHVVLLLILVGGLFAILLYYTYWSFKERGLRADYYRDNYLRYGRSRDIEEGIKSRLENLLEWCTNRSTTEKENLAVFIRCLNDSDWQRLRHRSIEEALREMDSNHVWTNMNDNQVMVHNLFIKHLISNLASASPAEKEVSDYLSGLIPYEAFSPTSLVRSRKPSLFVPNLTREQKQTLLFGTALVYGAIGWYFDFAENGITVTGVEIYDAVFIVLWWPSYLLFWLFVGMIAFASWIVIIKITVEKCLKVFGFDVEPKD